MIGLIISLLIIAGIVFAGVWLYQVIIPLKHRDITLHTFQTRRKLYLIARCGFRFIVECATPEDGLTIPMPQGHKMECMIVEGSPIWSGFKLKPEEIAYMQQKLMEHLLEYYKWIQITEVLMPKKQNI